MLILIFQWAYFDCKKKNKKRIKEGKKKEKKSCKGKIIILNTCVNFDFPMVSNFLCFLHYLLTFFFVPLFVDLFVFVAHVFWVSFDLLLLFPTFVAAYPFALSCFVLCALCFAFLSISKINSSP